MTNSPTMCQYYVGQVLRPVRDHYPRSCIIHHMDDILLASQTEIELQHVYQTTSQHLTSAGLIIGPEKIQTTTPAS